MNIQEIRQMPVKKLYEGLKKARRELAVAQFRVRTGQNKNTAQLKKLKQTIARILTFLSSQKR